MLGEGSNVVIVPVQLSSGKPPSACHNAAPFEEVAFPEADFEDCSAYLDYDWLRRRIETTKRGGSSTVAIGDDVEYLSSTLEGKKRAVPGDVQPSKRPRSEYSLMGRSSCRFRVHPHQEDEEVAIDCWELLGSSPLNIDDVSTFYIAGRAVAEQESWLPREMQLIDENGHHMLSLPLVNTDAVPFDRQPHRLTNGVWLESLCALCGGNLGKSPSLRGIATSLSVSLAKSTSIDDRGRDSCLIVELSWEILYSKEAFRSALSPADAEHLHRLVRFCYPDDDFEREVRSQTSISASLIYSLLPSSKLPPLEEMQPPQLNPSLFPFQRRSVNFLLGREGKRVAAKNEDGSVVLQDIQGVMTHSSIDQLGLFWRQIDTDLFHNDLSGKMAATAEETQADDIRGGMLAEEMGLGKTVEVLALILLNRDASRSDLPSYYDTKQDINVSPTGTTLIVAPETLRQQWLDEIALHTPELRAFSYLGYREAGKCVPPDKEWREWSKQFDIIVASFDTLKKEINVARKEPPRSRRFERKYERPRSLLIELAFHRVVMDEVQLVGHSGAAETVSMIDRRYSLAVSGTPIKVIKDLKSLFLFLRILTPQTERHWERLQSPSMLPSLAKCFSVLATRHTKAQVKSEMILPLQTRVLVPVTFTAIEGAFYRDIYSSAMHALQIDPNSVEARNDLLVSLQRRFREDMNQLHGSLVSLRQACTHPQIAGTHIRNGNVLSSNPLAMANTIRSMDEVLTIMVEGTRADQALIWLQMLRKKISRVVLLLQDKSNTARLDVARETLKALVPVLTERIAEVDKDMERAKYIGPLYKFDKGEVDAEAKEIGPSTSVEANGYGDNASHALTQSKTQLERDKEEEAAEKRIHRTRHTAALSLRWRFFTEQLHRAHHFLGNVYFQSGEAQKVLEKESHSQERSEAEESRQIKEEDAGVEPGTSITPEVAALKKLEDGAYNAAEEVRQRLLKQSRQAVDNAIPPLDRSPVDFQPEKLISVVEMGSGGILNDDNFELFENTQDVLNEQAQLLLKWREEIIKRLRMPVSRDVSDEDENDDQYQENLDAQAEAEVLTEMYRVLLNERDFLLTGTRTEGSLSRPALYVELERQLTTKKRLSMLLLSDPDNEDILRQLGTAPTDEQEAAMKLQLDQFDHLHQENVSVWTTLYEQDGNLGQATAPVTRRGARNQGNAEQRLKSEYALENIAVSIRDKIQRTEQREEAEIARIGLAKVRSAISSQRTMCEKLKREHALFMLLFNARSAYFKHIQELSDDVGDITTSDIGKEMRTLEQEVATLQGRSEHVAGRLRYLLAIEEQEGGADEGYKGEAAAGRTCFICTEPLVKAVIFNTCGHSTCESCFRSWTLQRRQCPMCKAKVTPRDVYRVTYEKSEKGKKRQVQIPEVEKRKRQQLRYNVISEELTRSLSVMPIKSALGSKLDLLTRHLLYLEHIKPGTKSLIFTAFSRGITLVGDALRLNNIKFVTLDQGGAKSARVVDRFKNDGSVNVLLLHSEAQSSGLNLNVCENVFLLEPLVNHSIELQAIGRVHRIGQTRETTVYTYQVNNTVEERIVHLAAERGQSLVTKDQCRSQDLKDSAVMIAETQEGLMKKTNATRQGSSRKGEFVASVEEIFRCLFEEEEMTEREERNGAAPSASITKLEDQEEERERMRKERLAAVERRRAMADLDRNAGR